MSPKRKTIILCEIRMLSLSSIQWQSIEQEVLLRPIWEEQRFIFLRTVAGFSIRLVTSMFPSDIPNRSYDSDRVQSVRGSLFANCWLRPSDVNEFSTSVLHLVCTGMMSNIHGRITSQSNSSPSFSLPTAARIIVDYYSMSWLILFICELC